MRVHNFIVSFAIAVTACSGTPVSVEHDDPAGGNHGMVSTAHPIATEAGLATLRMGGNAHGLTIDYDADGKPVRFTGASDPRGSGLAKGC